MTEYKRDKPKRIDDHKIYTESREQIAEQYWTIENHLAEALQMAEHIREIEEAIAANSFSRSVLQDDINVIIHHIRKAWDKSE